jgi:hypothetical protein
VGQGNPFYSSKHVVSLRCLDNLTIYYSIGRANFLPVIKISHFRLTHTVPQYKKDFVSPPRINPGEPLRRQKGEGTMIRLLDLTQLDIANSILELQRASYLVEAELIEFYQIPQLSESLSSLQACQETFYGYYIGDALAGIISFKVVKDVLDIHRVAVHPKSFRTWIPANS